jgi:hypothetical protein
MSRMLELPDPVYEALLSAAEGDGLSPAAWLARRLAQPERSPVSEGERASANARLFRHVVSLGRATGIDNEQIDADLARSYLDPHEPEPADVRAGEP